MEGGGAVNHTQAMLCLRIFDDAMEYTMESEENEESSEGEHDIPFRQIVLSVLFQLQQIIFSVLG